MSVLALYNNWLTEKPGEKDLLRILEAALKETDSSLATEVLGKILLQPHCSEEAILRIKTSRNPLALAAWVRTKPKPKQEELMWLKNYYDAAFLTSLLEVLGPNSPEVFLKIAWKKEGGTTEGDLLRHEVLKSLSPSWHKDIPLKWTKWLLNQRPFTKTHSSEEEVFVALGEKASSYALQVALFSKDILVLQQIIKNMDATVLNWQAENVLLFLKECAQEKTGAAGTLSDGALSDGDLSIDGASSAAGVSEAELLQEVLPILDVFLHVANLAAAKKRPGLLRAVALELLKLLPEEHNKKLAKLLAQETPNGSSAYKELLKDLEEGRVSLKAVELATNMKDTSDPLWQKVATHANLTVRDAASILTRESMYSSNARGLPDLETVCLSRSEDWLKGLFEYMLVKGNSLRSFIHSTLEKLERKEAFLQSLVQKNSAFIEMLESVDLLNQEVIEAVLVKDISGTSKDVQKTVMLLVKNSLQEDEVAWDIFTNLYDEYTGSLKELLLTSKKL